MCWVSFDEGGKDNRLRCNCRANQSKSPSGAKAGGQGQAEGVLGTACNHPGGAALSLPHAGAGGALGTC